jgi:hypothetical protein
MPFACALGAGDLRADIKDGGFTYPPLPSTRCDEGRQVSFG